MCVLESGTGSTPPPPGGHEAANSGLLPAESGAASVGDPDIRASAVAPSLPQGGSLALQTPQLKKKKCKK